MKVTGKETRVHDWKWLSITMVIFAVLLPLRFCLHLANDMRALVGETGSRLCTDHFWPVHDCLLHPSEVYSR
jgi:hypothetical protein